jgi:hypothetical protein
LNLHFRRSEDEEDQAANQVGGLTAIDKSRDATPFMLKTPVDSKAPLREWEVLLFLHGCLFACEGQRSV